MARVELQDEWVTSLDAIAAKARLEGFLKRRMHAFREEGAGYVAEGGSQLTTRLMGGWFVNAEQLPHKATVSLTATAEGVKVAVVVAEDLGFGLVDGGLKKKYAGYFEGWVAELKGQLPPR
jgi:hypothetical protein